MENADDDDNDSADGGDRRADKRACLFLRQVLLLRPEIDIGCYRSCECSRCSLC